MNFDLDAYFYALNPALKKCFKGHMQPDDHNNDCKFCVAVFGYKKTKGDIDDVGN